MVHSPATRRAALVQLLAQPTAREQRPCSGCTRPCRCSRASYTCGCGCSAACEDLSRTLSRDPDLRPVHPVWVPVLYELLSLRMFTLVWPTRTYYCAYPSRGGTTLSVRSRSLEYVDLLSHRLEYLAASEQLRGGWRVFVAAHMARAEGATFSVAPTDPQLDPDAIAEDLLRIGQGLAASIRQLAQLRLFQLRQAFAEAGSRAHGLSLREQEVLDLFLAGLSVTSIAGRLFISLHTVRNHIKHICAKLEVRSQSELRELFTCLERDGWSHAE